MISVLYVAAGGALGALSRWGLNLTASELTKGDFPYATFIANIVGSFFMGILVAYFLKNVTLSDELKLFLTVGFLGSFTTFSTFSIDAVSLFTRGEILVAITYIFASVILSIGAVMLGTYLVWKVPV